MKFKKTFIFVLIPIVIVLSLSSIYWVYTNQSKKLIDSFLGNVTTSDDFHSERYIHPRFKGDLNLIDFLSKAGPNLQYKVVSSRKANMKEYKVSTELTYNDHTAFLDFRVLKDNGRWLISHMPEYSHVPAALFLGYTDEKGKGLKFDIKGESIVLSSIKPLPLEKMTPISLHIIDGHILNYNHLRKAQLAKVLRYDSSTVEDIYAGYIDISSDISIYRKDGEFLAYATANFIPVGTKDVYIYSDEDDIIQLAIYDTQLTYKDKIRVLINNSSHTDKTHESFTMLCDDIYTVKKFDGDSIQSFEFAKGDKIIFRPSDNGIELYHLGSLIATSLNRWHIEGNENSTMYMQNIERAFTNNQKKGTPYRGNFEVSYYNERLLLINELPVEKYLYSVVTSEMPVSFGLEALKVQSIAARAYALASLDRPGFSPYGAHIDDSTASQMYNNTTEHPTACSAVDSTSGIIPLYEGEIVDTRFFSTSPGYTAASNEVWSDSDGSFPGTEVPYLVARPQYTGDSPSLHNEENFRSFIDNINKSSYDRYSSLFRWSVKFPREVLEAAINENLAIVQSSQPQFVLTQIDGNHYEDRPIPDDIGMLLNMVVTRRGHGGNIMELEISTTSGNYKVRKELNIRNILKPINYIDDAPLELKCHDGSVRENFPLLPSAFAYIDIDRDSEGNIIYVTINGGGYGHGVGMSQYGTYGLTLLGKDYRQILEHYYPGCELQKVY